MADQNADADAAEDENEDKYNFSELNLDDPIVRIEIIYQLWRAYADFHVYLVKPMIAVVSPPVKIMPQLLEDGSGVEFVYPIIDFGYKLSTSKAEDLFSSGMSMTKMYNTIEKMIAILIDRTKTEGGATDQTEIQVAFAGHELCQRKGFEVSINSENLIVTNFDPGPWGDEYLKRVKAMAARVGYPPKAPRDIYRRAPAGSKRRM